MRRRKHSPAGRRRPSSRTCDTFSTLRAAFNRGRLGDGACYAANAFIKTKLVSVPRVNNFGMKSRASPSTTFSGPLSFWLRVHGRTFTFRHAAGFIPGFWHCTRMALNPSFLHDIYTIQSFINTQTGGMAINHHPSSLAPPSNRVKRYVGRCLALPTSAINC